MGKQSEDKFNKLSLKPVIAPGSLEPITQDEIDKRRRRVERAEKLGQSITKVTSERIYDEEYENPYRVEAMRYILNDMDVPEELKRKIEEFEMQHKEKLNQD